MSWACGRKRRTRIPSSSSRCSSHWQVLPGWPNTSGRCAKITTISRADIFRAAGLLSASPPARRRRLLRGRVPSRRSGPSSGAAGVRPVLRSGQTSHRAAMQQRTRGLLGANGGRPLSARSDTTVWRWLGRCNGRPYFPITTMIGCVGNMVSRPQTGQPIENEGQRDGRSGIAQIRVPGIVQIRVLPRRLYEVKYPPQR